MKSLFVRIAFRFVRGSVLGGLAAWWAAHSQMTLGDVVQLVATSGAAAAAAKWAREKYPECAKWLPM